MDIRGGFSVRRVLLLAGFAFVALAWAGAPNASAVLSQCPPVGQNTGCAILITINAELLAAPRVAALAEGEGGDPEGGDPVADSIPHVRPAAAAPPTTPLTPTTPAQTKTKKKK